MRKVSPKLDGVIERVHVYTDIVTYSVTNAEKKGKGGGHETALPQQNIRIASFTTTLPSVFWTLM